MYCEVEVFLAYLILLSYLAVALRLSLGESVSDEMWIRNLCREIILMTTEDSSSTDRVLRDSLINKEKRILDLMTSYSSICYQIELARNWKEFVQQLL